MGERGHFTSLPLLENPRFSNFPPTGNYRFPTPSRSTPLSTNSFMWAKEDLNLQGIAPTRTSILRVYQIPPSARRLHKLYYSAFVSAGVSSLTASTTFSAAVSFSSSTFANAASALYFIFRDFALRSRTKYSFD